MLALGFLLERALAGESAATSPREALKTFCVLVIDDSRVDQSRLVQDPNIKQSGFWLYDRAVDVHSMPVLSAADVTASHYNLQTG